MRPLGNPQNYKAPEPEGHQKSQRATTEKAKKQKGAQRKGQRTRGNDKDPKAPTKKAKGTHQGHRPEGTHQKGAKDPEARTKRATDPEAPTTRPPKKEQKQPPKTEKLYAPTRTELSLCNLFGSSSRQEWRNVVSFIGIIRCIGGVLGVVDWSCGHNVLTLWQSQYMFPY